MEKEDYSELVGGRLREFSDRLRSLRNQKGVSAREMSLSLGQNVNYINLIENGKRRPSLEQFFSICEYLELTPEQFFRQPSARGKAVLDEKYIRALSSLSERQRQHLFEFIEGDR